MDARTLEIQSLLKSILLFSYQIEQPDISETCTRLRLYFNDLKHYIWLSERMFLIILAIPIVPCFLSKTKSTIKGYSSRSEQEAR